MIKLFRKVTPDFKLNICWRNIRLSDHFSSKLKLNVPFIEKNDLVYKMKCVEPCNMEYIGKTKRPLHLRISEHDKLKSSAIHNHILNCNSYNTELTKKFGVTPTPKERVSFLETRFTPIACNTNRYFNRTRLEAIAITLNGPVLNAKVDHKRVHIISKL